MFELSNKLILSALVMALAGTTTACSANLGSIPGIGGSGAITPVSSPAKSGASSGGSPTQLATPASTPAIPFSGGAAPGVENIGVHDNTLVAVANYVTGNMMIVNANGLESAIPLPSDPAQAAALQTAAPIGKSIRISRNACGVEIQSEGKVFTYSTVDISDNQGCIKISSLR